MSDAVELGARAADLPVERDGARARDDGAKRRQILEGARRVFLADGFDGASMNDVARSAGVSKGTLYVYFASKEVLFEALIRAEKAEQAEQLCRFDPNDHDVRAALIRFGVRLLDLMLRPTSINHFRTVVAVGAKFPNIGRAFYEAGPAHGCSRLAAYLDAQAVAGVIEAEDTAVAAAHFLALCKGQMILRCMLGVSARPPREEMEAQVIQAADTFLRAYAKRPA